MVVIIFEADPRNFEIYQENLKLNNLENHKNLQAFNLAVTSDGNDIFNDLCNHVNLFS